MDQKSTQPPTKSQQNVLLTVTVRNPERTEFEGTAKALSSVNERGQFDILPYHANFISLIREELTIHKSDGSEQKIPLQQGIVKIYGDTVHVLIGIETTEAAQQKMS